jgi:hypothetical protein
MFTQTVETRWKSTSTEIKVDEIRLVPPMRAAASESFAAVSMAGVLDSRMTARGRTEPDVDRLRTTRCVVGQLPRKQPLTSVCAFDSMCPSAIEDIKTE